MYKKTIKRGEREYSYYYTNVRKDGKVKNIFLSSNKEEALKLEENLREKNLAASESGGAKPSSGILERYAKDHENKFLKASFFFGILFLGGLFFYFLMT